jgi:hypothetical protein
MGKTKRGIENLSFGIITVRKRTLLDTCEDFPMLSSRTVPCRPFPDWFAVLHEKIA